MYLCRSYFLPPGFSQHTFIFTEADYFLHNRWKCVCAQWCSVPLYHLTRLLWGLAAIKASKLKEYAWNMLVWEPHWFAASLRKSATTQQDQMKEQTWEGLCHQRFLTPDDSNMTHVPLNLRKTNLVKTSEKFGSGDSVLLHWMPAQQTHLCKMFPLCDF